MHTHVHSQQQTTLIYGALHAVNTDVSFDFQVFSHIPEGGFARKSPIRGSWVYVSEQGDAQSGHIFLSRRRA